MQFGFFAIFAIVVAEPELVVSTEYGLVRGVVRAGARAFLGVPFAADTAGKNRWKPPQAPELRQKTWDGSQWGPGCFQQPGNSLAPENISEDCLNVNVFTPLNASSLPVMVWFHGGSFDIGNNFGAQLQLYDGGNLAQQGVVVAGFNYRLGVFGWLSLPGTEIRGNFGLMDQRFGLEWAQRNIAAFGGDPKRVTIWGESAGAMSVGIHLTAPKSRGLFAQAIMDSNPLGLNFKTQQQSQEYGLAFKTKFDDCKRKHGDALVECLRGKDTLTIFHFGDDVEVPIWKLLVDPTNWRHRIAAAGGYALVWEPTIDDEEFPLQVLEAFAQGKQAQVPILAGSNMDELLGLAAVYLTGIEHDALAMALFGPVNGRRVFQRYPAPGLHHKQLAPFTAMGTDYAFRCPTMTLLKAQARAGQPTFAYHFNHPPSMTGFASSFGLPKECEWKNKTCHGTELPYVFGNQMHWHFTAEELLLMSSMVEFWASFAKNGVPISHTAGAAWPRFDDQQTNLVFSTVPGHLNLTTESAAETCDFWDSLGFDHAVGPTVV